MAKILIASIGNVRKDAGGVYNPATYREQNGNTFETPYIIEAMKKLYGIEKFILFGTAGSDWEGLYEYVCLESGNLLQNPKFTQIDNNVYQKLGVLKRGEWANASEASFNKAQTEVRVFKDCIEGCLDVILLKYGLNDQELAENFLLLQQISQHIKEGDEVYFDITHAFRTLPIFELLVIRYLSEVLQIKASIVMISYGMFEVQQQAGYTPIVDVKRLLGVMDHLSAASEYKRFGTLYGLLEMQDTDLDADEIKYLRNMSEWTNINNIAAMKRFIKKAHSRAEESVSTASEAVFLQQQVYKDIAKHFPDTDDDMLLSISLAKWHFDKRRYLHTLIVLQEALITFGLVVCGNTPPGDYNLREKYRKGIQKLGNEHRLGGFFKKLSNMRNRIIHGSLNHDSNEVLVCEVEKNLTDLEDMYRKYYQKKEQQEALATKLNQCIGGNS